MRTTCRCLGAVPTVLEQIEHLLRQASARGTAGYGGFITPGGFDAVVDFEKHLAVARHVVSTLDLWRMRADGDSIRILLDHGIIRYTKDSESIGFEFGPLPLTKEQWFLVSSLVRAARKAGKTVFVDAPNFSWQIKTVEELRRKLAEP